MNQENRHILITGGKGLLGRTLTQTLLDKGYKVSLLSRSPATDPLVKTFLWNIDAGFIDQDCISDVDIIVHLAGEPIADKFWSEERKAQLIESRTKSIALVYGLLQNRPNKVKAVISASATGYYSDRGDEMMNEDMPPATDFLGNCCVQWEKAVDEGLLSGLRLVKFRTGVVLTTEGGALPKLELPVKLGLGSALGNGKQWVSWIHLADVVNMYLWAIENNDVNGVFNMVAPNPVTNAQLSNALARQLRKPFWAPNVPKFILEAILGEMSIVVLGSTKASAAKVQNAGFEFKFKDIKEALSDIYPHVEVV